MKRILLFILTNIAVMIVLSITLNIVFGMFGMSGALFGRGGINYLALFIFAAVFGMGGSFISLFMSKWMAKMMTGAQVIESPRNSDERWLLETVARQAKESGIAMPEVAIYDAPELNAFATGMSRNNSLVAVSTGLLEGMTQDEVEAVLAHEVSHVANGDMVTLTLIQGIVNTFVIFFARIVGYLVDQAMRGNNEEDNASVGWAYYIVSFIAEIIFGILASIIVMWFSRQREFRADAGSARLVGKQKMIAALQRLQRGHLGMLPDSIAAAGIARSESHSFIAQMFMTHPPLEDRIAALRDL